MKMTYCLFFMIISIGCMDSSESSKLQIEKSKPNTPLKYEVLKVDTTLSNNIQEVKLSLYLTENLSNTGQISRLFEKVFKEYKEKGDLLAAFDSTEYNILLYPSKRIAEYEGTYLARYYINKDIGKYVNRYDNTALKGYWMDTAPELSEYDIKFKKLDERLKQESSSACEVYFEYKELQRTNKLAITSKGGEIKNNPAYWEIDKKTREQLAAKYNFSAESISNVISYSGVRCK